VFVAKKSHCRGSAIFLRAAERLPLAGTAAIDARQAVPIQSLRQKSDL
jgi:hypothetical protein